MGAKPSQPKKPKETPKTPEPSTAYNAHYVPTPPPTDTENSGESSTPEHQLVLWGTEGATGDANQTTEEYTNFGSEPLLQATPVDSKLDIQKNIGLACLTDGTRENVIDQNDTETLHASTHSKPNLHTNDGTSPIQNKCTSSNLSVQTSIGIEPVQNERDSKPSIQNNIEVGLGGQNCSRFLLDDQHFAEFGAVALLQDVDGTKPGERITMRPGGHNAMKPVDHNATRPGGHNAMKPDHITISLEDHNAMKPVDHNAIRPGGYNAMKPVDHNAMRPGGHNAMKPVDHNAMRPGGHNAMKPVDHNAMRLGGHNAMKPVDHNAMRPGGHNAMKPGDHIIMRLGGHNTMKPADYNATKLADHNAMRPGGHNAVKPVDHNATKLADHNATKLADHNTTKPADHNTTKTTEGDGTETLPVDQDCTVASLVGDVGMESLRGAAASVTSEDTSCHHRPYGNLSVVENISDTYNRAEDVGELDGAINVSISDSTSDTYGLLLARNLEELAIGSPGEFKNSIRVSNDISKPDSYESDSRVEIARYSVAHSSESKLGGSKSQDPASLSINTPTYSSEINIGSESEIRVDGSSDSSSRIGCNSKQHNIGDPDSCKSLALHNIPKDSSVTVPCNVTEKTNCKGLSIPESFSNTQDQAAGRSNSEDKLGIGESLCTSQFSGNCNNPRDKGTSNSEDKLNVVESVVPSEHQHPTEKPGIQLGCGMSLSEQGIQSDHGSVMLGTSNNLIIPNKLEPKIISKEENVVSGELEARLVSSEQGTSISKVQFVSCNEIGSNVVSNEQGVSNDSSIDNVSSEDMSDAKFVSGEQMVSNEPEYNVIPNKQVVSNNSIMDFVSSEQIVPNIAEHGLSADEMESGSDIETEGYSNDEAVKKNISSACDIPDTDNLKSSVDISSNNAQLSHILKDESPRSSECGNLSCPDEDSCSEGEAQCSNEKAISHFDATQQAPKMTLHEHPEKKTPTQPTSDLEVASNSKSMCDSDPRKTSTCDAQKDGGSNDTDAQKDGGANDTDAQKDGGANDTDAQKDGGSNDTDAQKDGGANGTDKVVSARSRRSQKTASIQNGKENLKGNKNDKKKVQPTNVPKKQIDQPTIVFAKMREVFGTVDYVYDYLINERLRMKWGIERFEHFMEYETRSIIVVIYCKSLKVAESVAEKLHEGNAKSPTQIWCFRNEHTARRVCVRSLEEVKESLNNHREQITKRAEVVLAQHYDKIGRVHHDLQNLENKGKHISLQQFAELQKSKSALEDKEKEMNLQTDEFLKYLKTLVEKLEKATTSPRFETMAMNIRKELFIECNRLTNAFPIYARRLDIIATVKGNQVCVIIGETGSGKSTQMVQYFHQAGLASSGIIACTQPRKIAATSLATHVAKEMGTSVGQLVGYKVGMKTEKSDDTKVMYMTDHILLNECLKDRMLSSYSCIIIDEAHERSIHTDLLLGMIKQCLKERPELRVVITSATIDPKVFVQYFKQCPVLQVSGRMFPVEVEYQEPRNGMDSFDNYQEKAVKKAVEIHCSEGEGDILVFLTKPVETERCCQRFQDIMERKQANFVTLQLHGRLQGDEQQKVFDPPPRGKRKIVFATNSAETSVTIPGIKYVIDTGLANEMKFDAVRKISTLSVTMVTKSSARQRMGRAGRLGPGKCYRLYSEDDFKKMSDDALPEILKVHIGHAMLKLMELGVDPIEFDFIQTPSFDAMEEAFTSLLHIGAVKDKEITELGKWIAKMPFDPQYGAFVYEAMQADIGVEAIVVAAASGTGSVFYRGGTNEEKEQADKCKIPFCHEEGDQLTTLHVFQEWYKIPEREKSKWCVKHSVNGKSVKGIRETTTEVLDTLRKELKVNIKFSFADKSKVQGKLVALLFKALSRNVSHFLGHMKAGYNVVSKDQRVEIHPSSSLLALGSQPEWIVFDQVMRTSGDFAMQITPVAEALVKKGIEEGWLKLEFEEAKKKQIVVVCQEYVGSQVFRDFVGPRYVDLRSFEVELSSSCPGSVVVVEADRDRGELRVLAGLANKSRLHHSFSKVIPPLRAKYDDEESEERIGSESDFSERAILRAGGSTVRIFMPGEYRAVLVNCPLDKIEEMSVEDVEKQFKNYGKVRECIKFFRKNKSSPLWGKVVYETCEAAITAVEATREESELTARPNTRVAGNNAVGFNTKIQWCRRPSRGFGFVEFANIEDYMKALQIHRMEIGNSFCSIKSARNSPQGIHVAGFNRFVNEDVLRESFAEKLDIDPLKDIAKISVVRLNVLKNKDVLDTCKRRLQMKIEEYSNKNNFKLEVRDPRTDRDVNFIGYCSFKNPEEGHAACADINNGFVLNDQAVSMKADISSSVLIHRDVFQQNKKEIESKISQLDTFRMRVKMKELRNGNVVVELHTESIDALARARLDIQEVVKGETIDCQNKPKMRTLFSREGRRMLEDIMNKTRTLIITDNRVMSVSIHGPQAQRQAARDEVEEYVEHLSLGGYCDIDLMGGGKPAGVMKALLVKYQIHLGGLQAASGLRAVKLDHRHHRVRLFGSQETIDKATDIIKELMSSLSSTGATTQDEDDPDCVTCFCPVEPKDLYRLEHCGHPYCRECVELQMNTAITNKDFPIECGDESCSSKFVWRDFVNLSRLGFMAIANLVSASVGAYVSEHKSELRFCVTPDCPAVYRVTEMGSLFTCPECGSRLCTSCHDQYHDGFTCAMFRSVGREDRSLLDWMRQDPNNRKTCPGCFTHIEKILGCNKVRCVGCKKSICWVCMMIFDTETLCYGHLQDLHGSFT